MSYHFLPGQLLVPNDTTDAFAAVIRTSTGAFLQGGLSVGDGETGAILPNFSFCVWDNAANPIVARVFNQDLGSSIAVNVFPVNNADINVGAPFASDYQSTFYAAFGNTGGHPILVRSFDSAGTIGGTTWTLDISSVTTGIAVAQDNSLLYYVAGNGVSPNNAIKKWNLNTDATAGTLVANDALIKRGTAMFLIPDTNLLVTIVNVIAGGANQIRIYSTADGSLLHTYACPDNTFKTYGSIRIALDWGNTESFWIRTFPTATTTIFQQVQAGTGTVLTTYTIPYEEGSLTKIPLSCPFFPWTGSGGSDLFIGSETVVPMKRVRRVPLPILPGNARQAIGRVELQFQAGAGLAGDSAAAPQYVLAVSFNSGQTFGTARQMSAGLEGQFYARAYTNALGTGRFPVLDISCTDDFNSVLTDVMVTMEPQTG